MKKKSHKIVEDQELFFNQLTKYQKNTTQRDFFYAYVNKEQYDGFSWLADRKRILDYGCGTASSIDRFFENRKQKDYMFYGVDIAGQAIEKAKKKYPNFKFFKISNNRIPKVSDSSIDGAYMLHVLHHATPKEHLEIFRTILKKLRKNGKFLINDLSSSNPINRSARSVFINLPLFVKKRFGDDLVVGEAIPEKYKVNVRNVLKQLEKAGFTVEEVGYGHLFFFVFAWIDKFIPLTKSGLVRMFYTSLMNLEELLLKRPFFQNRAELFYIKSVKR